MRRSGGGRCRPPEVAGLHQDQNLHRGPGMSEKTKAKAAMTVGTGRSCYGTPEPQIELHLPQGAPYRRLVAALHRLAAEIELATPQGESWIVQMQETGDERGRVYLELADGDEAEATRGLALLRTIAP